MKRLVAAVGIVALAASPALAGGSQAAPTPTVRVTATSLLGAAPDPQFGVHGHWTDWDPGRDATLEVGGTNLPGVTSTAVAYWTSRSYPVQFPGLFAEISRQADHVGTASVARKISLRHRNANGAWSRWLSIPESGTATDGVVTLLTTGQGVDVRYNRRMARAQQIQVQIVDTISDPSTSDLFTSVQVLTA